MSSPIPTLESLPPGLQDAIRKEVAALLAANQPPPPRELTAQEKVVLYLTQVNRALRSDKDISAGSRDIHNLLAAALDVLAGEVFKQANVDELIGAPTTESAV